jgi:hypothetical protein
MTKLSDPAPITQMGSSGCIAKWIGGMKRFVDRTIVLPNGSRRIVSNVFRREFN